MSQKANLVIPQLIVGLGNPESKYNGTRHNIGFEVIDTLAQCWQISLKQHRRFQGGFGEGLWQPGSKIRLLKPTTYMNRSGQSVQAAGNWYKLSPQSLLVIYDDMDLPVGRLRMRLSGSAGGHNGIKSIISHLGGQNFPRLRIGIGKSHGEQETISHVLSRFSPSERKTITAVVQLVSEAVELSLKEGVEKAMSLYNSRSLGHI
ncbi:MAG: aminoacyl-tRNA hydrolase [Prochloron sp. SP5CPC1]|nr:aminoacyl-tRNA hydrolase [Candidatus Paraprochloron terpiosi SP5CPC1]